MVDFAIWAERKKKYQKRYARYVEKNKNKKKPLKSFAAWYLWRKEKKEEKKLNEISLRNHFTPRTMQEFAEDLISNNRTPAEIRAIIQNTRWVSKKEEIEQMIKNIRKKLNKTN